MKNRGLKENRKSNKNGIVKLISIIAISFMLIFVGNFINKKVVIADSGFDSSYDSGGSDWGSSSSDWSSSSSSWDSDYSSSSGGGSSSPGEVLASLVIFGIIIVFVIISNTRNSGSRSTPQPIANQNDGHVVNKIKQYIPDFDKTAFLNEGYNIYVAVQNAWMNFKLDEVKNVLTDEMFNMYESQLATLEVKGEQNIMKDFVRRNAFLKDVVEQNGNVTITACYVIEFYDYIVEQSSGKVLRGTSARKVRITYDMKFRKTINAKSVLTNCPNCGAKLEDMNGAGTCKYCGSKIVYENSKWVLTDKKNIGQIRL